MEIYFLKARFALTKAFEQRTDGQIVVASYPHAADFKSSHQQVASPIAFDQALREHALLGECLLKGVLNRQLNFESRAGSTDPFAATEYLVLDIDGLLDYTVEMVMTQLDMDDVTYIVQYSSSQGVVPKKGLSCHIFVMLARPAAPTAIKQWLIKKNLDLFASALTLTRSGCALHYPLDITACQNDKLIYIAPPICTPPSIDQFNGERIQLVQKNLQLYGFPDSEVPAEGINRNRVADVINDLRAKAGMKPRKSFEMKTQDDQEYLSKPDIGTVTGVKDGRGFTYLNVNGGDSWGYWHPTEKIEFIYNFKGEPVYKTSEFLPSYYNEHTRKLSAAAVKDRPHNGREYLVFRDAATDTYYNGWYDTGSGTSSITPAGNKTKLADFQSQYGLKPTKVIPDWICHFNPSSNIQIDPVHRIWNRFCPSQYMREYPLDLVPDGVPNTILAVIRHVIGDEDELIKAFLNWTAYAFQKRRATGTAWMLQGVPGTGKGILVNHILKPLFGATNTTARRMEELEDKFNGYMEACLLCYIDEVFVGASKRADMILANLKNQISEPSITIRNMRQTAYETPNYLNWVFSSNMPTPIELDREDRRFNVGNYQTQPLREIFPDTAKLVHKIETELDQYAAFLTHYVVDETAVRVPVKNQARQTLIENSLSSLDIVGEAILKGDLETLVSYISDTPGEAYMQLRGEAYKALMAQLIKTRRDKLSRDELYTIFSYAVGDVPSSPAKFTRFLTHRNIRLKKIRVGDRTTSGIDVIWHYNPEWLKEAQDESSNVIPLTALSLPKTAS